MHLYGNPASRTIDPESLRFVWTALQPQNYADALPAVFGAPRVDAFKVHDSLQFETKQYLDGVRGPVQPSAPD